MNFLHDRIGQIGQDLADDLQARAPELRKFSARPASRAYDRKNRNAVFLRLGQGDGDVFQISTDLGMNARISITSA
jgi:hypothetical protein